MRHGATHGAWGGNRLFVFTLEFGETAPSHQRRLCGDHNTVLQLQLHHTVLYVSHK